MTPDITCKRCLKTAPGLASVPFPGRLGAEILAHTCADCWAQWTRHEVMVINELRLNFIDPSAQTTLHQHLREFLALDGAS
ncbi:MAG: oxidative damage protection protein [Acidobacteriota bacterium]